MPRCGAVTCKPPRCNLYRCRAVHPGASAWYGTSRQPPSHSGYSPSGIRDNCSEVVRIPKGLCTVAAQCASVRACVTGVRMRRLRTACARVGTACCRRNTWPTRIPSGMLNTSHATSSDAAVAKCSMCASMCVHFGCPRRGTCYTIGSQTGRVRWSA